MRMLNNKSQKQRSAVPESRRSSCSRCLGIGARLVLGLAGLLASAQDTSISRPIGGGSCITVSKGVTFCSLPDKPKPKHETRNFWLLEGAHVFITGGMIYTYHDGARQCQREDNLAGEGKLFGTADGFGRRPENKRVLIPAAIAAVGAGVAHFTGHDKIANKTLEIYSVGQGATAVATWWYGCN